MAETTPQTFDDLISDAEAKAKALADDDDAMAKLGAKRAEDKAASDAANKDRDAAVVGLGEPVVVDNGDGTYKIYELASGSDTPTVKTGVSSKTPLHGGDPTPAPDAPVAPDGPAPPAPDVAPVPAPDVTPEVAPDANAGLNRPAPEPLS